MIEFKLPELGENVSAGDVMRVLIKPGDAVAAEQAVLELETDKATIEVPSSVAGTVKDVKVKPGEKVKVGQTIFTVDEAGGAKEAKDTKEPAKEPAKEAADKPKAQPEGAPDEGGLSQQAQPTVAAAPVQEKKDAEEDREGGKPGISEAPRVQRAPRLPEDEIEEPRPQKRGEVVDMRGAPRAAQAPPTGTEGP